MNITTGKEQKIADNVGRSIHCSQEGKVYFTQVIDSVRWICRIESERKIQPLIECIKDSEDFVFGANNLILCGSGAKLFYTDHDFTKGWRQLSDFERLGVKQITRIAISPDYKNIALVDNQKQVEPKK